MPFAIFILLAALANVSGNLILKYSGVSLAGSILGQLTQPMFWVALFFWGLNLLLYSRAVQYVHISVAYATLVAATVILLALSSGLIFHDGLSIQKWIGIAIIVVGVAVIFWN